MNLTTHEREVLEALDGRREIKVWGAWVSACLEFLGEAGLCTRGPRYSITPKGRALLSETSNAKEGE